MAFIHDHLEQTFDYLEKDFNSHKLVISINDGSGPLNFPQFGGHGFAMSLVSCATLDYLNFIIYGGTLKGGTGTRFKQLINDKTYFDFGQNVTYEEFYLLIRNGLMHQLYPKNMSMGHDLKSTSILRRSGNDVILDPLYLYQKVMEGFRKFLDHLHTLSLLELKSYEERIEEIINTDLKQFGDYIQSV